MDTLTTELPTAEDLAKGILPNFLAGNIRLLRKRMGLSQQELAERVGLNRGNIASYELGTAEPKICNLLRISKLVGVSSHDLTRLDLTLSGELERAYQAYHETENAGEEKIELLLSRADSLELVLNSISNIYQYRFPDLDYTHPDVKALTQSFEQMQEMAHTLLLEHRSILTEIKCHCK